MSNSEPRLVMGEGLSDVHALPASVGQLVDGQNPSLTIEPSPIQNFTQSVSSASHVANDLDALPPLISLSDLILEAPAWLFSAALHMLAIILLGLLFIVPERPIELILQLDEGDGFEELLGDDLDVELDLSEESLDAEFEPQEELTLDDPVLIEPAEINPLDLSAEEIIVAAPIRSALTGRSKGNQQRLIEAYGGNGITQSAVGDALRWLWRNQPSRGLWSLKGPYEDGSRIENREAATGLALLAFQGAGYTPESDPKHDFTKATAKGWKALLKKQKQDGSFFSTGSGNSQLYTHAICTIALCELYGMTNNSKYRKPAQQAIDYCVRVQSPEGGWRYFPGSGSDLSVTGWFTMALQSARIAGLEVPTPALQRVSGYLDSVEHSTGFTGGVAYSYQPRNAPTSSMTAEGLLCRQYLGWAQSDKRLRRGTDLLLQNLPSWESGERNVYYWYYATQVCHHMEGGHWRTWNDTMKVIIPKHQVKKGDERGSWDPKGDEWGNEGGRLFVTCLSTYMLEVYYRHLPIYSASLFSAGE